MNWYLICAILYAIKDVFVYINHQRAEPKDIYVGNIIFSVILDILLFPLALLLEICGEIGKLNK